MIATPYLALAGSAAILAAGLYAGSQIEHGRHVSREAKALARIEAARVKLQGAFDRTSAALATAQQTQATTFTEIRHVAGPIVYRSTGVCGDAEYVRVLDDAAAAANRAPAFASDGAPATAADLSPQP